MDKLRSVQLQVVLPGTRTSFRRRVVDSMQELVPAPGAFCFFGRDDSRAYGDSTHLVDGLVTRIQNGDRPPRLSTAFGFDAKSVALSSRRAYHSSELWPDSERAALPYFSGSSLPYGFTQTLLLFLHEGGVLFGLAGLERRGEDPPFGAEDKRLLEELAPFIVAGARSQLQYDELSREAAALRALSRIGGILYVIDRDKKRTIWAADRQNGIDWDEDVEPLQEQLVEAAERSIAARARGDGLVTPPRLKTGAVVAVAEIKGDPVFGGARCAVVRVEPPTVPAALDGLSKREREIARLLVAGYSGVNVAAIAGLSENTVRTYVRRLYSKLGVNNRADLVRKLVSPETASIDPASPLAPPPDSSLVAGDDTLD